MEPALRIKLTQKFIIQSNQIPPPLLGDMYHKKSPTLIVNKEIYIYLYVCMHQNGRTPPHLNLYYIRLTEISCSNNMYILSFYIISEYEAHEGEMLLQV